MTDELHYERIVAAPPEEVFDAFTSTGGQLAFYGQDDPGWIVRSESELRVGGVWTIVFGPSPERLYRHRHVFEVIDRPRRLLLSTTETRLDGSNLKLPDRSSRSNRRDGGTLITMTQRASRPTSFAPNTPAASQTRSTGSSNSSPGPTDEPRYGRTNARRS